MKLLERLKVRRTAEPTSRVPSQAETPALLSDAVRQLDSVLEHSTQQMSLLAEHFRALAEHSDELLSTASSLVEAAGSDSTKLVLPLMRRIYDDAEAVLQQRLKASAGLEDLFLREKMLLEELARPSRVQRTTALTSETLSTMMKMEISRLGDTGQRFVHMSGQLEDTSHMISRGMETLRTLVQTRQAGTLQRHNGIQEITRQTESYLDTLKQSRSNALHEVDRADLEFQRLPAAFAGCVQSVSGNLNQVISAVQMHDLTRQQAEHVSSTMQFLLGRGTSFDLDRQHRPALLRVQAAQVEDIRVTMQSWIREIDDCVAAILRLGETELLSMVEQIVCLQTSLEKQNQWMGTFEREFLQHDQVSEEGLNGFEQMVYAVREHLRQSRSTSEHLQLLNMNSMVAAHNVGADAVAISQLTSSINRIAVEWCAVTTTSVQSIEATLSAAASTGAATREIAADTQRRLSVMHEESANTISELKVLSAMAHTCKATGHTALQRMLTRVRSVQHCLQDLRNLLNSVETVAHALNRCALLEEQLNSAALPDHELRRVEKAYCDLSTFEVERNVVRRVLFGKAAEQALTDVAAGELELF